MTDSSETTIDTYEQRIADSGLDSAMERMRKTLPEVAANIDRAFAPLRQAGVDAATVLRGMRVPMPRLATETGDRS